MRTAAWSLAVEGVWTMQCLVPASEGVVDSVAALVSIMRQEVRPIHAL